MMLMDSPRIALQRANQVDRRAEKLSFRTRKLGVLRRWQEVTSGRACWEAAMSIQGNRLRRLSPGLEPATDRSGTGGAPEAARMSSNDQPIGPELLTDAQLAERWQLSRGTLANQRSQGRGPAYIKIAGRVRYRRSDIETYEQAGLMETHRGPVDARITSRESIELLIRSAGA
jgi:hypothetical protein